ncbi:S-adenosyl-L-methionine-dependent methyltransferases superfamily protein [Wolffia australiana]
MAELFCKQAKNYAAGRPRYPAELFRFIASKTRRRSLAWDVATGNGQAASSLAEIYDTVVATDASAEQLACAPAISNVQFRQTPPSISPEDLHLHVAPSGTVDLITVAQALHWFSLPSFYVLARAALSHPGGVIAAWCYTSPRVDDRFDRVYARFYASTGPYWALARRIVDLGYVGLDFPFDPVEGEETTGPFKFEAPCEMNLEGFFTYVRSWSAYQTAIEMGVDLLDEAGGGGKLRRAWAGPAVKTVVFPVHLKIGRV